MSSYAIAESYNLQTLLWAVAGATYRAAMTVRSVLPALWSAMQVLTLALLLTMLITGAVVLVAAVIPPTFWIGLVITGGYAVATYPRSKAVSHAH